MGHSKIDFFLRPTQPVRLNEGECYGRKSGRSLLREGTVGARDECCGRCLR